MVQRFSVEGDNTFKKSDNVLLSGFIKNWSSYMRYVKIICLT